MAKNSNRTPNSNTGVPAYSQKCSKPLCDALIDWFSVTLKKHTIKDVISFFGEDYVKLDYAINRYDYTLVYHEKIKILISSREDMNICIWLSGRACRELEQFYSWDNFFRFIKLYSVHKKLEYIPNYHISRIDYSFDFYNWEFNIIEKVRKHYHNSSWTSIFRSCTCITSMNNKSDLLGESYRWGRRDSNLSILFYDKLKERLTTDDHRIDTSVTSWIRLETNFLNENAMQLFDIILDTKKETSKEVCSIIYQYLDFKVNSKKYVGKNKYKRPTARWWNQTLNTTIKTSLSYKAYQSSIDKKMNYVEKNAIKSLSLCMVSYELLNGQKHKESLLKQLITKSVGKINEYDLHIVNEHLQRNKIQPISLEQLKSMISSLN